jgi:hypothetical protein
MRGDIPRTDSGIVTTYYRGIDNNSSASASDQSAVFLGVGGTRLGACLCTCYRPCRLRDPGILSPWDSHSSINVGLAACMTANTLRLISPSISLPGHFEHHVMCPARLRTKRRSTTDHAGTIVCFGRYPVQSLRSTRASYARSRMALSRGHCAVTLARSEERECSDWPQYTHVGCPSITNTTKSNSTVQCD